ncbi:extracellular solute-binding protein [Candidatus Woesearchaeota archaeon]|nr:extracellular solute-binding protein [Candidatus Woesearchaeota archaeon]
MKKQFSLVLSLILCVVFISSCSTKTTTLIENQTQEKVYSEELNIIIHQWMLSKYNFEDAAKNFELNHPGVKVSIDTMDNKDPNILLYSWRNGSAEHDLAFGWDATSLKSYIEENLLYSWDNLITEYGHDKFVKSFLDLGKSGNSIFVIPMTGEVMAVTIRKDLFKSAGLLDENNNPIPPKTWDEFLEYAKKLTVDSNKDGIPETYGGCIMSTGQFISQNYIYGLQSSFGNILNVDSNNLDFESNSVKEMLGIWKESIDKKYLVNDTSLCRNGMKQGTVAMLVATHSRWPEVENEIIVDGSEITIMPWFGNNYGSLAFMHGIWAPKNSKNIELAKSFIIEEILNDNFLKWSQENYGKMSPLKSTYTQLSDARWNLLLSEAENAIKIPDFNNYAKFNEIMLIEMTNLFNGHQTVNETLNSITIKLIEGKISIE